MDFCQSQLLDGLGPACIEDGVQSTMYNTCTVDNYLYMLYLANIELNDRLLERFKLYVDEPAFRYLSVCLVRCTNQEFSYAKYLWSKFIELKPSSSNSLDFYGSLSLKFDKFFAPYFSSKLK